MGVRRDIEHSTRASRSRLAVGLIVTSVIVLAGVVLLINRGQEAGPGATASASAAPLTPTRLTALPNPTVSNGTAPLRVRLSAPPSPQSPRPTLRPAVAGSWSTSGDSEYFTPVSTLEPCSTYKLTVWANTTAGGHSRLGRRRTITLNVPCPPITGLQQALARLGYLPGKFHSLYGVHIARGTETRRLAAHRLFAPPHGRLDPDPADAPPIASGELDETTRGALIVYQENHNLEPTGEPNRQSWVSLLSALTLDHRNPHPYTWVSVTESIPETLEVHHDGHVVLSSPANTGVTGAETAQGVFPIFSRFTSTTMTGTNPDGSKYSDPGVPWVNYFNGGDAVHGFPRGSYGSPQSNGCVELPIETAHSVYEMLQTGDIVWVT